MRPEWLCWRRATGFWCSPIGVVEAINEPGVEYGEERLIAIVNANADSP